MNRMSGSDVLALLLAGLAVGCVQAECREGSALSRCRTSDSIERQDGSVGDGGGAIADGGVDRPDGSSDDVDVVPLGGDAAAGDATSTDPDAGPECKPGHVPISGKCVRDSCVVVASEAPPCGGHGACSDGTASTPTCACFTGYELEANTCVRNPCAKLPSEPDHCDPDAECTYAGAGVGTCACDYGYEGDGKTCARNACVKLWGEPEPCEANQDCTSLPAGAKQCSCKAGWGDCDAIAGNGCEIDLTTEPSSCGACGFACAPDIACAQSACTQRLSVIAGGALGTVALRTGDGRVLGWGSGSGATYTDSNGNTVGSVTPMVHPSPRQPARDVASGLSHACSILADGTGVECWGKNDEMQLGTNGTGATRNVVIATNVKSLSAAYNTTCMVAGPSSLVYCWGSNANGLLGGDPARGYDANAPIPGVANALEVGVGRSIACARTASKQVLCWGYADGKAWAPQLIVELGGGEPILQDVVALTVGWGHACGLLGDGTVACWGDNDAGQLGQGDTASVPFGRAVKANISDAAWVEAGQQATYAVTTGGSAYGWGGNNWGQLGNASGNSSAVPITIAGLSDVLAVYSGPLAGHACALQRDARVLCWGYNYYQAIGVEGTGGNLPPHPATTPTELTKWP